VTESPYLVGLRLAGKKVVVVGGGTVCSAQVAVADRQRRRRARRHPHRTPAVESMSGITLSVREYRDGDLDGAWYAIAATDDAQVNADVVAEAERRRIFACAPMSLSRGPRSLPASSATRGLSVGVLAGGEAPQIGRDPVGHPRGVADGGHHPRNI